MGNQTTVVDVGIGGAAATLLIWIVSYCCPALAAALPAGGEAAIALVVTSAFAYVKKPKTGEQ